MTEKQKIRTTCFMCGKRRMCIREGKVSVSRLGSCPSLSVKWRTKSRSVASLPQYELGCGNRMLTPFPSSAEAAQ